MNNDVVGTYDVTFDVVADGGTQKTTEVIQITVFGCKLVLTTVP